jgi:hypothetical protein
MHVGISIFCYLDACNSVYHAQSTAIGGTPTFLPSPKSYMRLSGLVALTGEVFCRLVLAHGPGAEPRLLVTGGVHTAPLLQGTSRRVARDCRRFGSHASRFDPTYPGPLDRDAWLWSHQGGKPSGCTASARDMIDRPANKAGSVLSTAKRSGRRGASG